jgi:hypothetical protein
MTTHKVYDKNGFVKASHPAEASAPDERRCTCHPDDAPVPCHHKYALHDCLRSCDEWIEAKDTTITRLTAEVERLKAICKHAAETIVEQEHDLNAHYDRVAELEAALEWFVKREKSIMADVLSSHRNRGNGASQWMSEDDADFRRNLRQAFETARAALKEEKADG